MAKPKLWTKDFLILSSSNFLFFLTFYSLMVTITEFATVQFHASESTAGLASSIFVIGALVSRIFAGNIVEKYGRKRMLIIGLSIVVITTILYLAVNNLPFLLLNRFIHGTGFGIASTATGTIVANIIPGERRGEGTGYFGMSVTLAMAIGPFLSLVLRQYISFNTIFIICTVLAFFSLFISIFVKAPEAKLSKQQAKEMSGLKLTNFIEPKALPIAFVSGLAGICYSSILSFFTFYAQEINLVDAASFFFVVYAVVILLSRPFTGRWFDVKGANFVMYPALLLFMIGMFLLSQSHHGLTILLAGALIGLGYGTYQSNAQAIAVKVSPEHRMGMATSTFYIFQDFGIGIGPFLLGFILPVTGYREMYGMIGVLLIVSIVFYHFLCGKKSTQMKQVRVG